MADAAEVPTLIETVYAIERKSWKEGSGTSISAHAPQQRFYQVFAGLAARHTMLSAHVLRLDGRPLAYTFSESQPATARFWI